MKKNKLNFNKSLLMFTILTSSLIFLNSCLGDDSEDQRSIDDQLILKYLNDNDIDYEKGPSDYYYTVIDSNDSGTSVNDNDILSVYYKMSLLNGTKIDSIVNGTDEPVKFKITEKSLIPVGLRLGATKMREGEKFRFFIPSHLAYDHYSYEDLFPEHSILIIESEIVKIETEDEQKAIEKDSIDNYITDNSIDNMDRTSTGLYYKRVSEGEGDNPIDGSTVKINFVATYLNGDVFYSTVEDEPFTFNLGSNSVIKGLEQGIKLMKKGENATLIIPSDLAYDESLQVFPEKIKEDLLEKGLILEETPPFSILKIDIEVVDIL